jgi:cellobiose phosphorylase
VYQAATQYILGIQPTFDGLRIDPCIPAEWDGFTVKRYFRGVLYEIRVKNIGHVNRGVKKIVVDGEENEGLILPLYAARTQHVVDVTL